MEYKNPASTVDIIVPYKKGIILIKRKKEPYKNHWALPGGFIDYGKETLEEAAKRELQEETGLITKISELELIGVYSKPTRDPRNHTISHVYEARETKGTLKAADDALEVKVFKTIPKKLAFDHEEILKDYFERTRRIPWDT